MCGFVGAFELTQDLEVLRSQVLKMAKKIRHRGPDWSGIYCGDKAVLAHERLSIVDITSGGQPLYSKDKKLVLAAILQLYLMVKYIITEALGLNTQISTNFNLNLIVKFF